MRMRMPDIGRRVGTGSMELLRESTEIIKRGAKISTQSVEQFIAQLLITPLAEWHHCATHASESDAGAATRALEHAIRSPDSLFAAWLACDHVETALYRFRSVEGRRLCPPSRLREVRIATERAALALLVRESLRDEHFRLLRGGFAALGLTPSPSAPPR